MFIRSTPDPVTFAVESSLEDWEYAYRSWSSEKLRIVMVMSVTNRVI